MTFRQRYDNAQPTVGGSRDEDVTRMATGSSLERPLRERQDLLATALPGER
jgi:hypothetical protein